MPTLFGKPALERLTQAIIGCQRCPRLRAHCTEVARVKKREFRDLPYWGKPVPGFGDARARLWIVGLAPAAHGANRTGRMFTGDSSGRWLFQALHRHGFSSHPESPESIGHRDGFRLRDAYISSAARCAPPDNKPSPTEILHCAGYLDEEYRLLRRVALFVALGSIGFESTLRLLQRHRLTLDPKPRFGHDRFYDFGEKAVLASYHPSRHNTQTGRLSPAMWDAIFAKARAWLDSRE